MHHETKALADVFSESRGVDIVGAGDRLLDETGNLGCNLVRLAGAALGRQQSHQTIAIEVGLHLVEGRARHAERRTRLGNGLTLAPHPSQHLVLDLRQIVRIEEVAFQKSRVSNTLRTRIGGAALFERAVLGIRFERAANHCNDNIVNP